MSYPHCSSPSALKLTQPANNGLSSEQRMLLLAIENKLRQSHILQYMIDLRDQSSISMPGITAEHCSMFDDAYIDARLRVRGPIDRDNYMTSEPLCKVLSLLYKIVYQGQINVIKSLSHDQINYSDSLWRIINSPAGLHLPNGQKCEGYWLDVKSSPNLF